jgi:hypothetical protein
LGYRIFGTLRSRSTSQGSVAKFGSSQSLRRPDDCSQVLARIPFASSGRTGCKKCCKARPKGLVRPIATASAQPCRSGILAGQPGIAISEANWRACLRGHFRGAGFKVPGEHRRLRGYIRLLLFTAGLPKTCRADANLTVVSAKAPVMVLETLQRTCR